MPQLLVALYRLTQRVELPAVGLAFGRTVGLRGEYDCADCQREKRQEERGGCPLLPPTERRRALSPHVVDSCGSDEADLLWRCPRGLAIEEPLGVATVESYLYAQEAGGLSQDLGVPLSHLPRSATDTWAILEGARLRLIEEVREARRQIERQARALSGTRRAA